MNSIRLEHPGTGESHVLGGRCKVFVNGQELSGVLELVPNFLNPNEVSSVTITLSVTKFSYGPEEQFVEWQPLDSDGRTYRAPVVPVRD